MICKCVTDGDTQTATGDIGLDKQQSGLWQRFSHRAGLGGRMLITCLARPHWRLSHLGLGTQSLLPFLAYTRCNDPPLLPPSSSLPPGEWRSIFSRQLNFCFWTLCIHTQYYRYQGAKRERDRDRGRQRDLKYSTWNMWFSIRFGSLWAIYDHVEQQWLWSHVMPHKQVCVCVCVCVCVLPLTCRQGSPPPPLRRAGWWCRSRRRAAER